jgi:hypothetical protein
MSMQSNSAPEGRKSGLNENGRNAPVPPGFEGLGQAFGGFHRDDQYAQYEANDQYYYEGYRGRDAPREVPYQYGQNAGFGDEDGPRRSRRDSVSADTRSSHSFNRAKENNFRKLKYNGKTSWETFIKQFELLANFCKLADEEKLNQLLVALSDDAADYVFSQDDAVLENYAVLRYQMNQRFQIKKTRDNWQSEFYSRKWDSKENLAAYAADLKRLLGRAYPNGLTEEVKNDLLIKQFFDGIGNESAKYSVRYLQHPQNMDEAVEKMREYLSFEGHGEEVNKVRQLRRVGENQDSPERKPSLQEEVQVLLESLNSLMRRVDGKNSSDACYKCGEIGHYARDHKSGRIENVRRISEEEEEDGSYEVELN